MEVIAKEGRGVLGLSAPRRPRDRAGQRAARLRTARSGRGYGRGQRRGWDCPWTSAITASVRRFSSTWVPARCTSSPTTATKIFGLEGYGLKIVGRVPIADGADQAQQALHGDQARASSGHMFDDTVAWRRSPRGTSNGAHGDGRDVRASVFALVAGPVLSRADRRSRGRREARAARLRRPRRGRRGVRTLPGCFEIPLACRNLIDLDRYDALVALGVVIRGETPHFDFVAGECARGIMDLQSKRACRSASACSPPRSKRKPKSVPIRHAATKGTELRSRRHRCSV